MSSATLSLGIILCCAIISWILFILFGQLTVRKLRKNPETKHELGIELVSGWDIINVAQSLALPITLIRRFRKTQISFFYSDADLLIKHTSKFDRILAKVFYWTFTMTGILILIWVCLVTIGILK
ncbi:hypothetical protein SG34_010080 [Thalassomonas viridans]|uniref:Uncharacterized protein n=1 Tax=Thalassomonas viridans TaxID=137584 RepID=A0AAE9Z8T9_9GAMM|nr:hypothetical protein [Thalassomonas viridans]WDE07202.1 hypothetical protein SG34_010080 [Thalassomonas viridans]